MDPRSVGLYPGHGNKSREWDLNDWSWDGQLFLATPNGWPCAPDPGNGRPEMEKRRREDGPASLTLNLGGSGNSVAEAELANWDGRGEAKRGKLRGGSSNNVVCQVGGCDADLSDAKDYHRRHKVCEMHAKAGQAMVGNVMQRFCQQCSRFHLLQEFDEGKRSCRRRLAGHNRRRRKTNPDASANVTSATDDQTSSYILITLLKILSNIHSGGSDQFKDQDFLSHLLRNITSIVGPSDASNLSRLLQASQDTQELGNSAGTSSGAVNAALLSNSTAGLDSARTLPPMMTRNTGPQGPPLKHTDNSVSVPVAKPSERHPLEDSLGVTVQAIPCKKSVAVAPARDVLATRAEAICSLKPTPPAKSSLERVTRNDFDLNYSYIDAQDVLEGCEQLAICKALEFGSPDYPSGMRDSHQSSPQQTSHNSDSTSAISLSNSNGDAQSRTDRIVFKLFGKDPNDLPLSLRGQVLNWLTNSPTDMESYMRPGCLILTVYLRLPESGWEELSRDLTTSLNSLVRIPGDNFWGVGWIFASIQRRFAFIHNGQVVLDSPLQLNGPDYSNILSITPIAVSLSASVNFEVKGFNLARPSARLLCAFEGKYVVSETPQLVADETEENDEPQCCILSCSLPNAIGRGFIEVEDNGVQSGFFPFVVAEEDVCTEIRMLESTIEEASWDDNFGEISDARNQAINLLHEMGWLLRTSHLRSRSEQMSWPNRFPLTRFMWLMAFAMDREWCAVVKKLLDILFEGSIESGGTSPAKVALSEDLLHRAVRKNCKSMVELLLRYTPLATAKETTLKRWLFKPDELSSGNLTPLHIAASITDAEGVVDALTNDPGQLGIKAWSSVRDVTGFTPEDYARARGFESYIDLVQKKAKGLEKSHTVVDVPASLLGVGGFDKQPDKPSPSKQIGFQIDHNKLKLVQQTSCRQCDHEVVHRGYRKRSFIYRPVMLSMVGIAAVCVCVGLLLKSPPEVLFVKAPFRWENVAFGWM